MPLVNNYWWLRWAGYCVGVAEASLFRIESRPPRRSFCRLSFRSMAFRARHGFALERLVRERLGCAGAAAVRLWRRPAAASDVLPARRATVNVDFLVLHRWVDPANNSRGRGDRVFAGSIVPARLGERRFGGKAWHVQGVLRFTCIGRSTVPAWLRGTGTPRCHPPVHRTFGEIGAAVPPHFPGLL